MRVMLVNDLPTDDPGGGGAEVYVGRLMAALARAGHEIDVFAGQVRHAGAARVLDLWDPRARAKLVRRVQQTRPDVVHFHNVVRELSVAALLVPAPRVLTAHDILPREPRPGQRAAQRRLYDRFDAVIVHSEHGRRRLVEELGVDAARVSVIPHGVLAPWEGQPAHPPPAGLGFDSSCARRAEPSRCAVSRRIRSFKHRM